MSGRTLAAFGLFVAGMTALVFWPRTKPKAVIPGAGPMPMPAPVVAPPDLARFDAAIAVAAPPPAATKAGPADAVAAAIDALDHSDRAAFAATFLPSVKITDEAFAACRVRVKQVPVRPDWAVAEDAVVDGHAVRRVSMFGKSMTGFHELDGHWLADALWCVPVGLP